MSSIFNYSTQGIWVGGTTPSSWNFESIASTPLNGVQSSQVTLGYQRQDINDWAGGGEPVLSTRPGATLQFSYVFSNGINENSMGFALSSFLPALTNLNNERNYYVTIDRDHRDLIGYAPSNMYAMAFGNGVITKYDFNASVGQPSTCSVTVDCLNVLMQSGTGNPIPYVNKQPGTFATGQYSFPAFTQSVQHYFEAAPSAITLTFNTGSAIGAILSGNGFCPVQTFGFSIDLSRMATKPMGWAYPNTRSIRWPVTISMHADAYMNALQIDALNRLGCPDSGMAFSISFQSGYGTTDPFSFQFIGAKLTNQTFSTSTADYTKVSLNWTCKIYDINQTSGNAGNLFFSYPRVAYSSIIFNNVNWGTGVASTPLVVNLSQPGYLSIAAGSATLNSNTVTMLNEAGTVTVQINVSGSSETQQIVAVIQ